MSPATARTSGSSPVPPDLAPGRRSGAVLAWALVSRRDETRESVLATIEVLTSDPERHGLDDDGIWLPAADPFRRSAEPTVR